MTEIKNGRDHNMNLRDLVLSMLKEIYAEKEFSHILIREVLEKYDYLEAGEKAFIKRLTEGTLERTIELDYCIDQYSSVCVKKMKPLIRALLRMSVYQILYMDSVPDSAACNEAVKLAAQHKFTSLKGFVNGVLRKIAREKDRLVYPNKETDFLQYLSVTYSVPLWIAEHFVREYGKEKGENICAGLLKEHPVTVRLQEDETDRKQLLTLWEQQGYTAAPHPYLPYAYVLDKVEGIQRMAGFAEGRFAVQDVSSMLVAEAAGIKPGMQIMDVCAAPGGKATHAAWKLHGTGEVLARDLTEYKVRFLQENADRQKLTNLRAEVWDACVWDPRQEQWADILFCDVPCSGLGVMGKKRDIKYRLTPDSLSQVAELQRQILSVVVKYVKKGGILMYSTCTIHRGENQAQVQWLTENFPFEVVSMQEQIPEVLAAQEGKYGLQLLPGIQETDGFFLCKLRRI